MREKSKKKLLKEIQRKAGKEFFLKKSKWRSGKLL